MNTIIRIMVSKIIELAVKYAEKKFTEVKAGNDKKAYVLKKVDEVLSVDNTAIEGIKEDLEHFIEAQIELTVFRFTK